MKVWVFDDNLMWSARIKRALEALGHEPALLDRLPEQGDADAAIVNLGSARLPGAALVPALRDRGVYTIGHAGHKERELLDLGREAGCDRVATNSEIAHKLGALLAEAAGSINRP